MIGTMRKNIIKYGFLQWIFISLRKILKKIFELLIFRKKEKKKNPMGKIYQKWEKNWLSDEQDKAKAKEDPFFLLFEYDYEYSCKKAVENKKKNFHMKFLCVLPFLIVTILYLGGVLAYNLNVFMEAEWDFGEFLKNNNWNFSIYGTVFYVVAVLLTYVVSKWLDVRQYQETWCRHSEHKYAVEKEILRFISYMDEYKNSNRKQEFIKNIMKTWDEDHKKFIENMKKEKDMKIGDILKSVKGDDVDS